jgi:hypothetical protein
MFDLRCKMMKAKVASKDMGAGANDVKTLAVLKYSLARLKIKLRKKHL